MNLLPLLFIAFCTTLGGLLNHWLLGATIGLGIILAAGLYEAWYHNQWPFNWWT